MGTTSIAAHVLEIEALRSCLSLWYNYIRNPALYGHYLVWTGFYLLTVAIPICVSRVCDKQVDRN
jgi:hypothetical protein